jgi:hypothetical protein
MAPFIRIGGGCGEPGTGQTREIDFLGGGGRACELLIAQVRPPAGNVLPHWIACRENERGCVPSWLG